MLSLNLPETTDQCIAALKGNGDKSIQTHACRVLGNELNKVGVERMQIAKRVVTLLDGFIEYDKTVKGISAQHLRQLAEAANELLLKFSPEEQDIGRSTTEVACFSMAFFRGAGRDASVSCSSDSFSSGYGSGIELTRLRSTS